MVPAPANGVARSCIDNCYFPAVFTPCADDAVLTPWFLFLASARDPHQHGARNLNLLTVCSSTDQL
jgi:hypothetical protein